MFGADPVFLPLEFIVKHQICTSTILILRGRESGGNACRGCPIVAKVLHLETKLTGDLLLLLSEDEPQYAADMMGLL